MKILQIITSLRIGGAEKLIVDMVPLIKMKGYEVDVLVFDGVDTPFKKQLQDKGIKIYQLSTQGLVYNPLFILKLIVFLRQYNIVHTHNTACQYYTAIAKYLSLSCVKLVTTEHNTTNRRRNIAWLHPIDKFIYKKYNAIISVSYAAAGLLKQYLGTGYAIEIIFNGINVIDFQNACPLDKKHLVSDTASIIITMVAGFREQKDQDTLIKALLYLPLEYYVCLVGDGVRRKTCETLVNELGLNKRVIFTGNRSDIPQIMKASDIIVMSSHWEGFGLAAVEGMACGKPVVASDIAGLADIVRKAGILFKQGDEKSLARIIQKLINDKQYYRQTAMQCMQRASEYDIHKTVASYEKVYERIFEDAK